VLLRKGEEGGQGTVRSREVPVQGQDHGAGLPGGVRLGDVHQPVSLAPAAARDRGLFVCGVPCTVVYSTVLSCNTLCCSALLLTAQHC